MINVIQISGGTKEVVLGEMLLPPRAWNALLPLHLRERERFARKLLCQVLPEAGKRVGGQLYVVERDHVNQQTGLVLPSGELNGYAPAVLIYADKHIRINRDRQKGCVDSLRPTKTTEIRLTSSARYGIRTELRCAQCSYEKDYGGGRHGV